MNLLPTTLVGSYPQPEWLIDRKNLAGRFPQRVRVRDLWRVQPDWLETAQDDATWLAIRDQERAGLDIAGKTIILGVLDLSDPEVDDPETVAARIRRALRYVSADRIVVAPDCGMKYLPRDVAFAKMKAIAGAALVRSELVKRQSA